MNVTEEEIKEYYQQELKEAQQELEIMKQNKSSLHNNLEVSSLLIRIGKIINKLKE